MADETPGADQVPPPKTRSLLGYLPLIILVLLLQAGGAYYLIDRVLFRKQRASAAIGQGVVETLAEETGFKDPPDMLPRYDDPEDVLDLEEMQTNPAASQGNAVVFFKVSLGYAPAKAGEELKRPDVMARIKDDVLSVFSSHTPEMMDQPDDKRAIREEIKVRLNAYLTRAQIVDVYLQKVLLQVPQ